MYDKIQVVVEQNEVKVLVAEDIFFETKEGRLLLTLKNCTSFEQIETSYFDEIFIWLVVGGKNWDGTEVSLQENVSIEKAEGLKKITLELEDGTDLTSNYSTTLYRLAKSWVKEETNIDWRDETREGKKAWHHACLCWSGIQAELLPIRTFTIDCCQINCLEDVFCYIGEVFFGYRGYFGKDMDGFLDCLRSIRNRKDKVVIFKKLDQLKRTLDPQFEGQYKKALSDLIVGDFKSAGFQVVVA